MGFWESAGSLAKTVGKAALEEGQGALERSRQYREEMPGKSDRELAKIVIYEGDSPLKAGAAFQELKSRGYSTKQEVKAIL
ncbi:TPA: hypothetical protein ACNUVO_004347 [Aeromonas salmonicida subsp. pectinolytica]